MKKILSILTTVIIAIVLGCFTFISIKSNETASSSLSNTSNFIFLGVMVLIIFIAIIKCLFAIEDISNDFESNFYWISQKNTQKNFERKISFKNLELREAWENYLKEKERITNNKTDFISCDISDYIDILLINRIICKNICESIPGIMTGLGILGTFMGLLFGLQGFKIDNGEIQNSIVLLLNGIKTAFFTSIYGVIFSIIFNLFYKISYNKMVREYDKFINKYYAYVVPNTQNEVYSRLISSNESQRETMREFADNIGSLMVNKFQESMDAINNGIREFMSKAIVSQEEKMKMLIHEYLKEMNSNIFGGELEQLRETLHTINVNELENSKNIKEVVNEICNHIDDIAALNEMVNITVSDTKLYVLQLNEFQNTLMTMNDNVTDKINELSDLVVNNNNLVTKMQETQKETFISVKSFNETFEKFDIRVDSLFERTKETLESFEQRMSDDYQVMMSNIGDYKEDISGLTKEFSDNITDSVHILSEEQKNKTNEMINMVNENAQLLNKNISITFNDMKNSLENINKEISQNYSLNISYLEKFNQKFSDVTNEFYKQMENNKNAVLKFCENIDDVNQKSGNNLQDIIRKFEGNYEQIFTNYSMVNKMANDMIANNCKRIDESFEKLNQAVSMIPSELSRSLEEMNFSFSNMNKEANEEISSTMKQMAKTIPAELKKSLDLINSSFKSINQQTAQEITKKLSDFETETNSVIKKMNNIISGLSQPSTNSQTNIGNTVGFPKVIVKDNNTESNNKKLIKFDSSNLNRKN